MMKKVIIMLFFVSTAVCIGSEQSRKSEFLQGDRICFIGDSITHYGSYHSWIYLFYATRFPETQLTLYNCGIGGDTASGALDRFEFDIKPYKPSVAAIMFGVNDIGIDNYGVDVNEPNMIAARKISLDNYKLKMESLCQLLKLENCQIIILTPCIYDQTVTFEHKNNFGANDALGICSMYGKEIAKKYGCSVVDFYSTLQMINNKYLKNDPEFSIVGPDRIHPGDVGHFVMAYTFLKAQNVPKYVSKIIIDENCLPVQSQNCVISDLECVQDGIGFWCKENALPFPILDNIKPALEFIPFQQELNQEIIQIKSLKTGDYNLFIDDCLIGSFNSIMFQKGINLADYNTPQYRQALRVAEINKERENLNMQYRSILFVEHRMLHERIYEPYNMDSLKKRLQTYLEGEKGKSYYNFYVDKVSVYFKHKPNEKEICKKLENVIHRMYEVNKPDNHFYRIIKK